MTATVAEAAKRYLKAYNSKGVLKSHEALRRLELEEALARCDDTTTSDLIKAVRPFAEMEWDQGGIPLRPIDREHVTRLRTLLDWLSPSHPTDRGLG